MSIIRIQTADFDIAAELAELRQRMGDAAAGIGAIASFVGLVRDVNDGAGVSSMTLEHYPAMTERSLGTIVAEAATRWQVLDCTVVHRVGTLEPADQIVLVMVASGHRGDAFAACEFIMDYLKTQAPFWKKETTPDGTRWVEARSSDEAAQQRWEQSS